MSVTESKAALVTGAAQRVGREIAYALARDGWAVAVHFNSSGDAATALTAEIRDEGGRATAVGADLSHEADICTLVSKATAELGPVSCLINNAAIFEKDTVLSSDRETWDRHMQVNLRAPFVLIQTFAQALPEGLTGNVINMIDQRVWNLTPGFASYTLSKSALWTLTQTAAMALAPRIRVNAIGPGPTLPSIHQTREQFDRQCASLLLNKGVRPAEIVETIRFLLATPSITGQMIAVDGGQHLGRSSEDASRAFDG